MVDKMKFDENFFEDPKKIEKQASLKMKTANKNHPLLDNNFNKFILSLNEESFPNCSQEINLYNRCKIKYNSIILDSFTYNSTSENNYLEGLKTECHNEIIYVYNCLKRFGRYM
jgi:hypothetical protein